MGCAAFRLSPMYQRRMIS